MLELFNTKKGTKMQSHQLQCHIRAFAVLAEMEAMKAENENRTRRNEAQAYNENNFFALSNRLEELACEAGQIY